MQNQKLRPLLMLVAVSAIFLGVALLVANRGRDRVVDHSKPVDPEGVLAELRAGNVRYVSSRRTLSNDTEHDDALRRQLAKEQHPFAAILCCSDSRLCPAIIFDQPPGNIFEIRNAGNVVEDDAMASLEYAVEHLHVRFLFVLGHKGCGAIEAVVAAGDQPLHDHLRDLQDRMKGIRPQVLAFPREHPPDLVNSLAKENAREQAKTLLKESAPVAAAVGRGQIRLMFGMYDMETGQVEYFVLP